MCVYKGGNKNINLKRTCEYFFFDSDQEPEHRIISLSFSLSILTPEGDCPGYQILSSKGSSGKHDMYYTLLGLIDVPPKSLSK